MTDFDWIPSTVLAAATLISSLMAAFISFSARHTAREAKEQSVATHTAVNSGLDKMLKLITEGAVAQATLDEKTAQAERQAAINGAITAERDKAAATAAIAASAAATAASVALGKPLEVEVVKGAGVDSGLKVVVDKDGKPLG